MKRTVTTTVHGTDETSSVRTFEVDETAELPTLADIYKSEINVSIVTDWDAGYDWKLHGSPYTGEWTYTGNTRTFDDAVLAIRATFKAVFEPTERGPGRGRRQTTLNNAALVAAADEAKALNED